MIDWPEDLRNLVNGNVYMVEGGHEYDGRPLMPLDEAELVKVAGEISATGVTAVAISSIFSPLTDSCEKRACEILLDKNPKLKISESNKFGRIGLLERESVTILNACLRKTIFYKEFNILINFPSFQKCKCYGPFLSEL